MTRYPFEGCADDTTLNFIWVGNVLWDARYIVAYNKTTGVYERIRKCDVNLQRIQTLNPIVNIQANYALTREHYPDLDLDTIIQALDNQNIKRVTTRIELAGAQVIYILPVGTSSGFTQTKEYENQSNEGRVNQIGF